MAPRKKNNKKKKSRNGNKKKDFTKTVEIPVLTRKVKNAEMIKAAAQAELREKVTAAVNDLVPDLIDNLVSQLQNDTESSE
ncbi:MAG: hypothetical protein HKN88_10630 [Gammaproteobacteria bacterium]|nr:hypothetical protein [Gammaproteobacteria bacterium]NNC98511.1 hypothetical protein [Gammaproteobacteria bacterium]NNM13492.1 hypothetical protein [Gammaproteobacteria bacterium]